MSKTTKSEKRGLVPRLRFPEFLNAGAWGARKIGRYLTESKTKGSTGDTAKKLTVKLWGNGVYEKQGSLGGSENTQYYRRKAGQFIYSKLDFLNQAFGIIPEHLDSYESTVDLPCFDVSDELDARFFLEYVQRKDFYKKHGEIADGGRKAKRIQGEIFLAFPIYLPDKAEQQKIADCLSSLDALIAAQADKLDALKAHKRGLMQRLFPREGETVPELRFPKFRDAGEWKTHELGECLSRHPEYGINAAAVPYSENLPTYVRITDISEEGQIRQEQKVSVAKKVIDENYLEDGDIALARTGASVGKAYKYRKKDGRLVFAGFLIRIRPDAEKLNSEFLFGFLCTEQYWRWVEFSSPRSGQPGINGNQYASLPLQLPPTLQEQQEIAYCISSLNELIEAQAGKIDALKIHKKGLMQQLFPSPEAAEA